MPDYALNCVSDVRDLEGEIVTLRKRAALTRAQPFLEGKDDGRMATDAK